MEQVKEIVFTAHVDTDSIKLLIEQCADQKKVLIYLNSFGGSISAALAFHEFIRVKKIDVHVHVLSDCQSAAPIILCAGQKRTASAHARFLFHPMKQPPSNTGLVVEEVEMLIKQFNMSIASYNKIIAQTTNKTAKEIDALCKNQTLLSTTEALELGLLTQATFETELVTRSTK